MFNIFIFFLIISIVTNNSRASRSMFRGIFGMIGMIYGISFMLRVGFSIVPLLVTLYLVFDVAVPFLKGFFDSFEKKDAGNGMNNK